MLTSSPAEQFPGDTPLDAIDVDDPANVCAMCGHHRDNHRRIDTADGLEYFCPEEAGVDDIVRRLELADPRDRWKHTGEPPPPLVPEPSYRPRRAYCTPQSTVDAFKYVLSLEDPTHLKDWLRDHPDDAPFLLKQLESK